MTYRFAGPVLPDGETRDLYVVGDRITYEPQPGAETVARGWIVPGLVDAHCHIGLGPDGAVDDATAEAQALADRDGGALLVRDAGSATDTRFLQRREDMPRIIRCGRHVGRTRRYMRGYAVEVEPDALAATVAEQAAYGDGWVKLVGDWIDRDAGDLRPSFEGADFAAAIRTAHDHGARVTAHCFGHDVLPGLIQAGIDCLEHGTGLTPDLVEQMVAQGTALVPTVAQLEIFPGLADQARGKFPTYAATMEDLYARRRETLMTAFEAGVPMYAGSDGAGRQAHGTLHEEIVAMHRLGIPARDALAAASWRGREWLGLAGGDGDGGLGEGDPADFVVYDADPVADLTVLAKPAAVVLRGRLVQPVPTPPSRR